MTIQTAIVVEGGAMRGIYSAGVLDALLAAGATDFDLAIGTSAGACNLASFVSGQYERNLRCYIDIMCQPELFSLRRALRGGHFMELDWLWAQFAERYPLDEAAIARSRTELVSSATCARTGQPRYHTQRTAPHAGLKAGCALPLFYRGPVALDGEALVDGGVSDPIPAQEAYRRGARRMLVVRSRPATHTKSRSPADLAARLLLARRPALARAAANVADCYRRNVAFLAHPPADLHLLHLAPEQPLETGRTTTDPAKLTRDYDRGRAQAGALLPQIEALLEGSAPAD